MSNSLRKLVLTVLLVVSTAAGCTLIAEVDRSEIPTGQGGSGTSTAGAAGAAN